MIHLPSKLISKTEGKIDLAGIPGISYTTDACSLHKGVPSQQNHLPSGLSFSHYLIFFQFGGNLLETKIFCGIAKEGGVYEELPFKIQFLDPRQTAWVELQTYSYAVNY